MTSHAEMLDAVTRHFPILDQNTDNGVPLVYLDNAATTQKPQVVFNAISNYYARLNSNVHRGAHFLSERATTAFEQARAKVQAFIGADSSEQVIWTRGTTEAINLVANSWGLSQLKQGDLIVLTEMEHHANIVPWQLVAEKTGAEIIPVRLKPDLSLDLEHYQTLLDKKPRLVAFTHVSNAIGTINPVELMLQMAKQAGATTLVDGAQAVAHLPVNVKKLDCDFYVFSGHKLFGPTGIGVLYGKKDLLEAMPPWQGGGEMIDKVSFQKTTFNDLPFKFEAGTPNISGALGLATAIGFIEQFDREEILRHENRLFNSLYDWLSGQEKIKLYSRRENNAGILSFNVKDEHHQDVGTLLDQQGIAVRTGHHCTMPLMQSLKINGTVRASLSLYNTEQDIEHFISAMNKVLSMLDF